MASSGVCLLLDALPGVKTTEMWYQINTFLPPRGPEEAAISIHLYMAAIRGTLFPGNKGSFSGFTSPTERSVQKIS